MDFVAIAAQLGLSKGRISQLHAHALQLIREAYRSYSRLDVSV
jgi:DNA-directed RNA polymerase specialized sigma subunit